MRIMTWFQFPMTLLIPLVAILVGAIANAHRDAPPAADDTVVRVVMPWLALVATAILLGTAAALVRRGFAVAFPLVLLAEAGVAVDIVPAVRTGIRAEVRTFLLRAGRATVR